MRNETFEIRVNGFTASLQTYILNSSCEMKIKRRPLVFICPGGGYEFVSERESELLALKFVGMGYHAAVLKYSVKPAVYPTQLLEVAKAWEIIVEHSEEWNVIPEKIIICGCSAGAHLAASYGIFCGEDEISSSVNLSPEKLCPAGTILCYPVIMSGEFAHKDSFAALLGCKYEDIPSELLEKVSLEKQVTDKTPDAFIWHTYTDNLVPVENSLLYAMALKNHNVNAELHIFPQGGHGLCLANELTSDSNGWGVQDDCQIWTDLVQVWLKNKFGIGE